MGRIRATPDSLLDAPRRIPARQSARLGIGGHMTRMQTYCPNAGGTIRPETSGKRPAAPRRRKAARSRRKATPRHPDSPSPLLLVLGAVLLAGALLLLHPGSHVILGRLPFLAGEASYTALDPDSNEESWSLTLVNATHPLPDSFIIETAALEGGHNVDARIAAPLEKMLSDCRAAGNQPYIRSSFRTRDEQEQILNERIAEYLHEGYSHDEATAEALRWVARPGTSEHELGLAVDINDHDDDGLVYEWLAEHAHEYGFVLRYPPDKVDVTGIASEPWHYRYVGLRAASDMHDSGEVLEEYLSNRDG